MLQWHGAGSRRWWAAGLAVLGAGASAGLLRAEPPAPRVVTVEMTARRFAFQPAYVEAVEGDEVTLNVRSDDGTHGIEIRKLKLKREVPRGGEAVTLSFTAPAPGRYDITCSEYCGRGHDDMKGVLVVAPRGGSAGGGADTGGRSEPPADAGQVQTGEPDDPDLDVNRAQPDFMLASLPTTLRLPRNRLTFRLTHRFIQALEDSGLEDLFGMDSGALIGLEFRYGLLPGAQLGFYRTSDRTIELFTQYDVATQGGRMPLGIAAFASAEGTDNFSDEYSPALGAVFSRELGTRGAVYAEPFWVHNTNADPAEIAGDNSTGMIGLGLRLRVLSSTYLVFEAAPRIAGHAPGTTHVAFGIEQRAGGHLFQITFANNTGTTPANMARGGPEGNNWYLGFNLARKFY